MSAEPVPSASEPADEELGLSFEFEGLAIPDGSRQSSAGDDAEPEGQGSSGDPNFPNNQRDLAHHSIFGRRGHVQPRKSTRYSWDKRNDFSKPATVPWIIPLSPGDLLRLLNGFSPIEMEDKWFIYSDGPVVCPSESGDTANAKATVHFHRSWTGEKAAALNLDISWGGDDESGLWTGKVTSLAYDTESEMCCPPEEEDPDSLESTARFTVAEACSWVLGIHLQTDEPISEPKCWKKLAETPIEMRPITQTTHRGTSISQETLEDLKRIGKGAQILLS